MTSQFQPPAYTAEEARTRQTFLALMWSLSYPGRVHTLETSGMDAFHAIADTLLDLETSYFCPDERLSAYLARTGARAHTSERAAYHFYPTLTGDRLAIVETASIGTLLYPDHSALLIIGCRLTASERDTVGAQYIAPLHDHQPSHFQLEGPGVKPNTQQIIAVSGIPSAFWGLRAKANRYPRGWDIYLVDDNRVIGLPRTTKMTLLTHEA
jgi:alpha-D-ribose 1-methylphosphonate 5-triphosphate synthase subunit PhnH